MSTNGESARERRRQAIQAALDSERPAAERNRLGQFATPHGLAVDMARYLAGFFPRGEGGIRFADPAIGTGSFYSAALTVFGRDRLDKAVGVEIDTRFCASARELWTELGLDVVEGDFTRFVMSCGDFARPSLILANPPYVRHHHLSREDKDRLQWAVTHLTGVHVNGLSGLYVYFLILATAWMAEDGHAGWLIPSEFMDVNYGAALKRYLTDQVTLLRVHRFDPDDVQFSDALVSSSVVVFCKTAPPFDHSVEFSFGGTLGAPEGKALVPLETLRESRKWTAYPADVKNARRTSSDDGRLTLGDLFRIQRGIATGSNKFFVLDRREAERLELPVCYLRPILPSPRHLKATIIEADDDGYPLIERPLCVIDCDLGEDVLQDRYPALWDYLASAERLGVKEGYIVRRRTPWYRQERRAPSPFLCTYMGRGTDEKQPFRFIWNRSQAIGTNLYLMLYPTGVLGETLRRQPERYSEVFELLGQVTGAELRGEGRVYGGGLNKIEPRELGRVSAQGFVDRWPELASAGGRQGDLFRAAWR